MSLDLTYPHIEVAPGAPARLRRFPRIRVAQVAMDYLAHGWSAEEMCRQHGELHPGEVHAAMAYYFDHQDEIDREIQEEAEAVRSDASRPRSAVHAQLRQRGLRSLITPTCR